MLGVLFEKPNNYSGNPLRVPVSFVMQADDNRCSCFRRIYLAILGPSFSHIIATIEPFDSVQSALLHANGNQWVLFTGSM